MSSSHPPPPSPTSLIVATLQHENAALAAEVAKLRGQLSELVDECEVCSREANQRAADADTLASAMVSSSRVFNGALRTLWRACCSSSAAAGAGGAGAAVDMRSAQSALTAALSHSDKVQRALIDANLHSVAAAVAAAADTQGQDAEDAFRDAAAELARELRKEEESVLTTALAELQQRTESLQQELEASITSRALAEGEIAALQGAVTELQSRLAQAAQGPLVLDVDGESVDAAAVRHIRAQLSQAQTKISELGRAVASGREAAAATARSAQASAAAEAHTYLQRALDAEARVRTLEQGAQDTSIRHAKEVAEMRATIQRLESSQAQLARQSQTLRSELDLLQDKYGAQCGVVDMLRAELGESHARLARLHAHKTDMAKSAAAALREVEHQVERLSTALQQPAGVGGGLTARTSSAANQERQQ